MGKRPEDADAVICARVGSPLARMVAGSHTEQCPACKTDIWVAPTTPGAVRRICWECAMDPNMVRVWNRAVAN